MAKILSHVWSIARGSIAGITYLAGPTAAIIARQRVAPVQPGTIFQTFARNALDDAVTAWDSMDSTTQQEWDNYAQTVTYKGPTGNYHPTGRQAFMGARQLQRYMNTRLLTAPTFSTVAPEIAGFLLPSQINMGPPIGIGTGFRVEIAADVNDDTIAFINVSGPFDKERHFWKGPWDPIKTFASIIPKNTFVNLDRLGLQDGRTYFARVKCVSDVVGPRVSEEFFLRGVASTTGP